MYGASEVKYSDLAENQVAILEKNDLVNLPVCIAKAHLSLSNNPSKKGRPRGFKLAVEDIQIASGAGYIVVKCEGVNYMPGLPRSPRALSVDYDLKTGNIKGLF
jgi:formyltetrahydrofolate synthetase